MAWIKTIDEDEAEGLLTRLYKRLREPWGGVDNIFKIHITVNKLVDLLLRRLRNSEEIRAESARSKVDAWLQLAQI